MPAIRAYHIPATVTSWAQVEPTDLQSQTSNDGRTEYRFSMYPLLNCEEIETLQYKIQPGRIRCTCAFLICDESFSHRQTEDNVLLHAIGITIKGSVLLVGGKRLEGNKYLYNFDSLPEDYLASDDKVAMVLKQLACGWIMRNNPVPLPNRLVRTPVQAVNPQEYALEWHEQHRRVQQQVLSQFLQGADLNNQNLMMMTDAGCSGCGKLDAQMKRCGACKVTRYCSQDCQKQDRRNHIVFCNKVASS